jgi:hypothetical protein
MGRIIAFAIGLFGHPILEGVRLGKEARPNVAGDQVLHTLVAEAPGSHSMFSASGDRACNLVAIRIEATGVRRARLCLLHLGSTGRPKENHWNAGRLAPLALGCARGPH